MFLVSCDPFGMSCIENSNADTLKIILKNNTETLSENSHDYCQSFYENILITSNIEDYDELWDWYELMDTIQSEVKNGSIEICIPPKSIIITNKGILALRIFNNCPFEYAVFELNEKKDTLFDIQNFGYDEYKEFSERNSFKIHEESSYLNKIVITEITQIN